MDTQGYKLHDRSQVAESADFLHKLPYLKIKRRVRHNTQSCANYQYASERIHQLLHYVSIFDLCFVNPANGELRETFSSLSAMPKTQNQGEPRFVALSYQKATLQSLLQEKNYQSSPVDTL